MHSFFIRPLCLECRHCSVLWCDFFTLWSSSSSPFPESFLHPLSPLKKHLPSSASAGGITHLAFSQPPGAGRYSFQRIQNFPFLCYSSACSTSAVLLPAGLEAPETAWSANWDESEALSTPARQAISARLYRHSVSPSVHPHHSHNTNSKLWPVQMSHRVSQCCQPLFVRGSKEPFACSLWLACASSPRYKQVFFLYHYRLYPKFWKLSLSRLSVRHRAERTAFHFEVLSRGRRRLDGNFLHHWQWSRCRTMVSVCDAGRRSQTEY